MKVWACDVESVRDCFGIGVKSRDGEHIMFTSEPGLGLPLAEFKAWFGQEKKEAIFATINGWFYDCPMVSEVLHGQLDPGRLKDISDRIFAEDDYLHRRTAIDDELHVDLLALHGGKEQVHGSKEMAIKFNLRSVCESPVSFDAASTSHAEKVELFEVYNLMDLDTILAAFAASEREVQMRLALLLETGVNVVSLADAGVADKIMAGEMYPATKVPYPLTDQWRLPLAKLTKKVSYQHPELVALQERLSQVTLEFKRIDVIEKGQKKKKIDATRLSEAVKLQDKDCTLAKGGLHSDDKPSFYVADEQFQLWECDFKSFYPMIILHHRLCPEHIPSHPFLRSLKKLVDKRLAVRDTDPVLSNGLKIATNSIFGKSGSPYSWLCDPSALISCTLLGQLTLLMLIDLLLAAEPHVQFISANTDAVLFRVTREFSDDVRAACDAFAATQGQSLGWTRFSRVVKRDVNSYLGYGLDGRLIRAKGSYAYDADRVRGKACNRVVIDAVQNFFRDDTPVEQTIRAEPRVEQFISYRKTQKTHVLADDQGNTYGSIQRWVIVTEGGVHLDAMRKADGQRTQIVKEGAMLLPDLPSALPATIDYDYYIGEAQALILAITDPVVIHEHIIPLAEMSQEQRDRHKLNATTIVADLDKCAAINIDKLRDDYVAVYKGNTRDSMKACLLRLWWREAGALSLGDLHWLAGEIDSATGYFTGSKARNLEQMCEWIAHDISAFPVPRTTEEFAARALTWAKEHVELLKRRRQKVHHNATKSDFINGEALRHYGRTKNEYKLACHISSVGVKHAIDLQVSDVVGIIEDVKSYFASFEAEEIV